MGMSETTRKERIAEVEGEVELTLKRIGVIGEIGIIPHPASPASPVLADHLRALLEIKRRLIEGVTE